MSLVKVVPDVLTPDQISALVYEPDGRRRLGNRDKALLAMLIGADMWPVELRTIRLEDVKTTEDGETYAILRSVRYSPNAAPKEVHIPRWACRILNPYVADRQEGWLFPGHSGEALTTAAMEKIVSRHANRIGLVGVSTRVFAKTRLHTGRVTPTRYTPQGQTLLALHPDRQAELLKEFDHRDAVKVAELMHLHRYKKYAPRTRTLN